MAPGAEITAEIIEVMESYWRSYFEGDLSTWASFLPDDYKNIGSTREEIWNSKEEIVNYTLALQHQMVGMAELRNKQVQIFPYDPYFMVHELGDLYIKTEQGWSFYSPFRLSSLLHKTEQGWKILHQHGSYPDAKTEEGEAFAFQQISKENQELREAVRRRTAELEHKNRELETETALEKVRVTAMAMRKPEDMLLVCRTISEQLGTLGVKEIRNIQTVIINKQTREYLNYQYFSPYDTDAVEIIDYTAHPVVNAFVEEMLRSDQAFFTKVFEGKELDEWRRHRNDTQQFTDPILDKADAVYYYFFSIGSGALGLSTYAPVSEESLQIFRRFKNVFELSYKRYLDITQAEAQAREAQIEAALERTRTQSMLMQHSGELSKTAAVFHEQLQLLGIDSEFSYIWLPDEDEKNHLFWATWNEVKEGNTIYKNKAVTYPLDKTEPAIAECYTEWASGEPVHVNYVPPSGVENYFSTWAGLLSGADQFKAELFPEGLYYIDAYMKFGCFGIVIRRTLTEEENKILGRFTLEFERTYSRFLDLQKSEAQTREAEIQLALERVRARTMAMQQSEELADVATLLFQQVSELGIKTWTTGFNVWLNNDTAYQDFVTNPEGGFIQPYIIDLTQFPAFIEIREAKLRGDPFLVRLEEGEKIKETYQHLLMYAPEQYGKLLDDGFQFPSQQYEHFVFGKAVSLMFITYDPVPEAHDIFIRFGKVFEQTYTRFLDLQKAEAQAREAQIEAALERVRAQTMAMHNSEDVGKCIVRMFGELTALGVNEDTRFGIGILNHDNENNQLWTAKKDGEEVKLHIGNLDMSLHPLLQSARKAWKEQVPLHRYILEGEDLLNYYRMLGNAPDYQLRIQFEKLPEREIHYGFIFDQGFFYAFSPHEFTSDIIHIIQRFSSQFGQTYRRYLDLVKAERQAREAEIELALERVRARTMAMQKSDELNDVVAVLFDKLKDLRIPFTAVGIAISIDGSKDLNAFVCGENETGLVITNYRLPYFDNKISNDFNNILTNKLDLFVGHYSKDEKDDFYAYLIEHTAEFRQLPDDIKRMIFESPSYTVTSVAVNKAVFNINDFGGHMLAESEVDIIRRFARVFNQTYTRFLDLQKAEAQAWEAQIESSLERVRSATMAMHQSKQILDVIIVLCDQLIHLNFPLHAANIVTNFNGNDYNMWLYSPGAPMYPDQIVVPDFGSYFPEFIEAFRQEKDYAQTQLNREQKNRFFDHLFTHTIIKNFITPERKDYLFKTESYAEAWVIRKNTILSVVNYDGKTYSEEQEKILKRFSYSFEQSYTRFLDLQKAEALAREAEIELSMERIRAHAMAMKESADLLDIVVIMRNEFIRLGHEAHYFWHMRWLPDTYEKAMTSGDGTRIGMVMQLPRGFHEDQRMLDWEKAGEPVGVFTYDADGAIDYVDKMIRTGRFDVIDHNAPGPDDIRAIGGITFIMARTTHGEIGYSLPGMMPQPPAEDLATLARFAGVFDLAYKRFEDLKMKEWQNRQSQIELALERVRSRTMAMQKSDELKEVAHELRVQLASLGTSELETCAINLYEEYEDFMESWVALRPPGSKNEIKEFHFLLPKKGIRLIEDMLQTYSSGAGEYLFELTGEKGVQWMNSMSELVPEMYEAAAATPDFETTGFVQAWFSCYYFSGGALIMITMTPPEEEAKQILKRCTQVFGHAYRRFSDLKRAEAQAREAQIEAALEKVRARSLAMHKSEDLQTVVNSVFDRLKELEIEMDTSSIIIPAEDTNELIYWFTNAQGYLTGFKLPRFNNVIAEDIYREKESGSEIFSHTYTNQEKNAFWNHLFGHSEFSRLPDDRKKFILGAGCFTISLAFATNTAIQVNRYYNKSFTDAELGIIRRFAIVFEQAYTRFLDLQKAEAQAREAEIELALERVRARAMAMQTSEELNALIGTVFSELIKLDLVLTRCVIMIFNPETKHARWWMANSEAPDQPMNFLVPWHAHPVYLGYVEHWEERASKWVYILEGKQKTEWDDFLFRESELAQLPDFVIRGMREPERVYLNVSFYAFGGLTLASLEPLSDSHFDILKRFGKVFDLTYTRFNDLKLAEAQAREAKIEAALERIRARALAMQKSGDLFQVAMVLREQMGVLGQPDLESSIIHLYHHDINMLEAWYAYCPPGHPVNEMVTGVAFIPFHESEWSREVLSGYLSGDQDYTIVSTGDKLREWYNVLEKRVPEVVEYNAAGELIIPGILYYHFSKFGGGALLTISNQQPSVETRELQKKAAAVFDFAFTRFLDLQKAEDQAREANIETALEKVRGKAMSMQNSDDLTSTIAVFYHEIQGLGLTPRRCGVGLLNKESRMAELSTQNTTVEGNTVEIIGNLSMSGHPVLEGVYENWIQQKEYHPVLRGNEIRDYYQVLKPQIVFPDYPHDEVQYGYFFFFDEGGVYAWYDKPLEEDELNIYRRFTRVIQLTYKRYLDLKNSEANALEAIRQSSLDRLRAEISSMRSKQDLEKITPLLWNELKVQGVPFIRCGVFLMDESQQQVHTFLSTPDGSAIASFHLPFGIDPNMNAVVEHWRSKNIYQTHWDEQAFMEWTNTLVNQKAIKTGDTYLKNFPPEGLYLCFIPFQQGMLYAGNSTAFKPEYLRQMESLSSTFSAAYARYEDFIRLEHAKMQVEKTLNELKLTQSQLIQAEKMASLGQLTAGIAHEIQNPLNFVNNFSDVSKEMLDEMKTELASGNIQQAAGLADDVMGNLEKILHHGKRADSIVKGMLQHSRSISGHKELTDINSLCDEYLRLAYHGLRAKEKDFNTKVETDFDPAHPKVNLIPQDIGRVILNLINNAFYAVHEKLKQEGQVSGTIYKPQVKVSTRNLDDKIEICVKDNGNGIPETIRQKIFQPFFTTKPTGQGTGLGLSLSYDIIKAHGGELDVETEEGAGTSFYVRLPFQ